MKSAQITPSVTQLTRLGFVNAYLVVEDDGLTLIDTTIPGTASQLIKAAERLGQPIRRIALTHAHTDHIGSLDALKGQLGDGVQVLIPEIDVQVLDGQREWEGRKVKGGWPKVQTRPDVLLHPGDSVGSLEVIGAPGHTPGHVAFRDARDGALLCGDAFTTMGRVDTSAKPSLPFPLAALATWSPERVLETCEALVALNPALLAPGHGGAVRDPAERMRAAIARHRG